MGVATSVIRITNLKLAKLLSRNGKPSQTANANDSDLLLYSVMDIRV